MSVEGGDGFDGWLEQQLHQATGKASGPSPVPAQAQYHAAYLQGGLHMSVLAKVVTAVTTKGAAGLAVAFLAVGAAAVATEASVTGSANPTNWGSAVVDQVNKCKDALAPGQHGIGQCVSAFANTHGKTVSESHASGAREHASDARQNGGGHTPGPPADPGKPSNAPGGRPSTVPPTSNP
jgi:hypothetical protein